jgi:sugar lactone lactonase YvrE
MRIFLVLLLALVAATCGTASGSTQTGFVLPYDLVVGRDGTIYFTDRSRVLSLQPRSGRVRVHREVRGATELTGLARLGDGTLFLADLPSGRILRVSPRGSVTPVANVQMPADLLADSSGSRLWVASIADGVGLVLVDVATGSVQPFAGVEKPHGLDRLPNGDLVVHDGHAVSRVDGTTGAATQLAGVDAFEVVAAPNGVVYGATGGPRGGRVVRISPGGRVEPVAGTGRLGAHRDGRALAAPMLPSGLALARGGRLLVAQIEPVPAIRRVHLASGRIVTLARGR